MYIDQGPDRLPIIMVGHTSLCSLISSLAVTATLLHPVVYAQKCEKTKVAILGGGTAGITAAVSRTRLSLYYAIQCDAHMKWREQQALTNASIHDFIIVEYNADIGGRVAHTDFGKDIDGNPYTVELGANWVCSYDMWFSIDMIRLTMV